MKKNLLMLVVAALAATAISIAVADASAKQEKALEKTESVKATPLVINNSEESTGKVTIYLDGEVEFEYQGPIKVWRRNGEHFVEVHTLSCSCSENSEDVGEQKLEVDVNE